VTASAAHRGRLTRCPTASRSDHSMARCDLRGINTNQYTGERERERHGVWRRGGARDKSGGALITDSGYCNTQYKNTIANNAFSPRLLWLGGQRCET